MTADHLPSLRFMAEYFVFNHGVCVLYRKDGTNMHFTWKAHAVYTVTWLFIVYQNVRSIYYLYNENHTNLSCTSYTGTGHN